MEKLKHNHPYPNCPACEQVGQWKAKIKLQAAEEMARAMKTICDLPEAIISKSIKEYAINAYAAWEKRGER